MWLPAVESAKQHDSGERRKARIEWLVRCGSRDAAVWANHFDDVRALCAAVTPYHRTFAKHSAARGQPQTAARLNMLSLQVWQAAKGRSESSVSVRP